MKSFVAVAFAAFLAVASAGFAPVAPVVAHSPLLLAAGPGILPSYQVSPLALPHPILGAAPAGLVLKPALLAAPVVKTVAYAAPVLKAVAPAPIAFAAPAVHAHYH